MSESFGQEMTPIRRHAFIMEFHRRRHHHNDIIMDVDVDLITSYESRTALQPLRRCSRQFTLKVYVTDPAACWNEGYDVWITKRCYVL